MVGWRKDGAVFKYPRTFDGERQDVVPPLGVMLLIPISAVWLTWYLVLVLFRDGTANSAIAMSMLGGVAPILVGYAVITNRRWSRFLFVFSFAIFIALVAVDGDFEFGLPDEISVFTAIAALVWWVLAAYLFIFRKARAYYLILAGKPLPDELAEVSFDAPDWIVGSFNVFALVAELLMILLALGIFFFGLAVF